jgi:hypothetical protein
MNLGSVKKKDTVRVSQKDLQRLLTEHAHMAEQITSLQERMSELLEENRRLKSQPPVVIPVPEPTPHTGISDPFDMFGPDVYIDGSRSR